MIPKKYKNLVKKVKELEDINTGLLRNISELQDKFIALEYIFHYCWHKTNYMKMILGHYTKYGEVVSGQNYIIGGSNED